MQACRKKTGEKTQISTQAKGKAVSIIASWSCSGAGTWAAGGDVTGCGSNGQCTCGWVARPNVPGGEGKGNRKSAKNVRVVFRKPSYINKNHCYLKGIYRRFMCLCKFCIMLQFCCIISLKCCKKPAYGPGGMPSALSRHTYSCKCKFSSRGFAAVPHGK